MLRIYAEALDRLRVRLNIVSCNLVTLQDANRTAAG